MITQKDIKDLPLFKCLFVNGKVIGTQTDVSIEKKVLGSIIIDLRSIDQVIGVIGINYNVFSDKKHVLIYKAIKRLYDDAEPIDLKTVIYELKNTNLLEKAGGEHYVIELTTIVDSSAHSEYYSRILMQLYVKRLSICLANSTIQNIDQTDVFDLLRVYEYVMDHMNNSLQKSRAISTKEAGVDYLEYVEKRKKTPPIYTGFIEIDELLGDLMTGETHLIGSHSGYGKSAFALNVMVNMAIHQHIPCLYLSFEMNKLLLMQRLMATINDHSFSEIRKLKNEDKIAELLKPVQEAPIHIYDRCDTELSEIIRVIKKQVRTEGVKVVFVDYLQIINAEGSTEAQQHEKLSKVSLALKSVSAKLDIYIFIIVQLNNKASRETEAERLKTSQIDKIRGSGQIAMDASSYIGLRGTIGDPIVQVFVEKSRNGQINIEPLLVHFNATNQKFTTYNKLLQKPYEYQNNDVKTKLSNGTF